MTRSEIDSRRRLLHGFRIRACSAWSGVMVEGETDGVKVQKALEEEKRLGDLINSAMDSLEKLSAEVENLERSLAFSEQRVQLLHSQASVFIQTNLDVASMILQNDRAAAIKWAKGLLLSVSGPDPTVTVLKK